MARAYSLLGALLVAWICCLNQAAFPQDSARGNSTFSGNVSWYGVPFHGRKTASGRIFDMTKLTCAHRFLPFGTMVLVENPRTGQSVVVEVIDRGPFSGHRVMDLSREAARRSGVLLGGVSFVYCTVLDK